MGSTSSKKSLSREQLRKERVYYRKRELRFRLYTFLCGIVGIIGFLLILGMVGSVEQNFLSIAQTVGAVLVGFFLLFLAVLGIDGAENIRKEASLRVRYLNTLKNIK